MAICGNNCDNQTFIGFSSSISLSFYDEDSKEIIIKNTKTPIDIKIKYDPQMPVPSFNFVNATVLNFTKNEQFIPNLLMIDSIHAAIHFHLKPQDLTLDMNGYFLFIKFGAMPIINSTNQIYDNFKVFCPNSSKLNQLISKFLN
jgi:hypothetical protein